MFVGCCWRDIGEMNAESLGALDRYVSRTVEVSIELTLVSSKLCKGDCQVVNRRSMFQALFKP